MGEMYSTYLKVDTIVIVKPLTEPNLSNVTELFMKRVVLANPIMIATRMTSMIVQRTTHRTTGLLGEKKKPSLKTHKNNM